MDRDVRIDRGSWAQPFPRTWMLRPSAFIVRRERVAVNRRLSDRPYSARSVIAGSRRTARHAGVTHATTDTASMSAMTPA
jgi:hypothetical protein